MSAKEALKLKATGIKPAPLEQGEFSLAVSPTAETNAEPRALEPNESIRFFYQYLLRSWTHKLQLYSFATLFVALFSLWVHACVRIWRQASGCAFSARFQFIKADKPIMFL